jgi:hypothetical protein
VSCALWTRLTVVQLLETDQGVVTRWATTFTGPRRHSGHQSYRSSGRSGGFRHSPRRSAGTTPVPSSAHPESLRCRRAYGRANYRPRALPGIYLRDKGPRCTPATWDCAAVRNRLRRQRVLDCGPGSGSWGLRRLLQPLATPRAGLYYELRGARRPIAMVRISPPRGGILRQQTPPGERERPTRRTMSITRPSR